MPLVIPDGFADVAIEMRATGDPQPWYVTFGVNCFAGEIDVDVIGATVNNAWAQVMTQISDQVTHTGAKITVGQDEGDPIRGFSTENAAGLGDNGSAMLPQNCAALVHKQTNLGGRRAKGRFFWPLILSEGSVDNVGNILDGLRTQMQSAADAMLQQLDVPTSGAPMPMVILHGSEGESELIPPTPVTSLRVDGVISTQRKRLR